MKNTTVPIEWLKPGVTRTVRNNYKAVEDTSVGIQISDLQQWSEEFREMVGISENIVVYATRGTISEVVTTIAADVNVDIFNRTGKPSSTILGIQFVQNDLIPAGKMLMLDGDAKEALFHLVSENEDYRGLAIHKKEGVYNDGSMSSLLGSIFKVMPEGKFITGREKFMWIDLRNDAADTDLNMSDAGLSELTQYKNLYRRYWKASL